MPRNLWALGDEIAKNPSFWARMKHSGKGTSFRRAFKGSQHGVKGGKIVKAVGSGFTYALKQVPLPVVKDLLGAVNDALFKKGRSARVKHRIDKAKASGDVAKQVKFGWKDLDVQNFDRYRWKVRDAMRDLQKETKAFNDNLAKHAEAGNLCDEFVKVTAEFAYAKKRVDKLQEAVKAVGTLCVLTTNWLNDVEGDLDQWALNNKQALTDAFGNAGDGAHENCDDTVCINKDGQKFRLKHKKATDMVSQGASVLLNALDPKEFVSFSTPSSHKIKMDNPWTGKDYSNPTP